MSKRTRTTELVAAGLVLSFLALSSTLPTSYAQVITTTSTTATTATITSSAATPTSTNNGTTTTTGNGAPSAFLGVASTTGNGVIYYQGGQLNTATVQYSDELLSLDVTKTWLISTPAWSNLTIPASGSGGPTVGGHSATMSSDLTTLYLTAPTGSSSSPFLYGYNVNARTWSTDNAPAA
ncbi:hypothetical protein EDD21DRAFT_421410 [Dissophora ornata]|nr:hypothetical protein EDD21DRAFT_421410 [Dissophora ornata]